MTRLSWFLGALLTTAPTVLASQAPDTSSAVSAIGALFGAMRRSDTAAVRNIFHPDGRVIGVPSSSAAAGRLNILTVDAFVRFAGQNAPEAWVEKMWNPTVHTDGALATVLFDYDVVRSGKFSHCGTNSVQLLLAATGWKIFSMTFTSRPSSCPTHANP